jgi:Transglutaminase-like superfamily/Domain of unknown function (DUF4129)
MAVMVRALGYASRVAVGFLPGGVAKDRRFIVTTDQAHAWPEVYFKGFGWLAFEPTPTRFNPVAGDYLNPPAAVLGGAGTTQGETALTQNSGSSQLAAAERAGGARGGPGGELLQTPQEAERSTFPLIAVVLVAAAILLVAGRSVRRRYELFRARSPHDRVIAAYGLFESLAGDVGLGRRRGETPLQYQNRLRGSVPSHSSQLERLTVLLGRALYSLAVLTRTQARDAVAAAKAAAREVRRHAGLRKRVLGTLGIRR